MKKALVILSALLLLLVLTGCGVNKKLSDKMSEQIAEGILGEDVDIDLDDGKIKIKGDDGSEWTMGEDEWPKGGAAEQVPEFKKGKIGSAINSADSLWIDITGVDEKDFQEYVETLKKAGFDRNVSTYKDGDNQIYSASREEGTSVTVSYSGGETMVISVTTSSQP